MPNLNGTGPEGSGSLTGRKMGRCRAKESLAKEQNEKDNFVYRGGRVRGGGLGLGGGRRRHRQGFRRGFRDEYDYKRENNDISKDSNKNNEE